MLASIPRIFSPSRQDRLCGPSSRLSNAYGGTPSLGGSSDRGVKLTTHLHLVPTFRMRGAIPPFSQYVFKAWCLIKQEIYLNGVVLS